MKQSFHPNRCTHLRLLLVVVLLLFQQVSLASYACSVADMPITNMGMAMHCSGMPMVHDQQNPALCPVHCTDQALTAQNMNDQTVPPVSMPALLLAPIMLVTLPQTHVAHEYTATWRLSGTPPALRFRVLLI